MASRTIRRAFGLATAALALCAAPLGALAAEIVLVPSRVIYPGETIDPAALKEVTLKEGRAVPEGMLVDEQALAGKVAKRTLLPGRYIAYGAVREAWLVEQGAAVQVLFVVGSLTISATVVTLQPGAAGDLIKVRNIDSGKIFAGTVMADGSIRVGTS